MIPKEKKEEIVKALQAKIPILKCPMCSSASTWFTMTEGYFLNSMQSDLSSVHLGGPAIPTIGIICDNCGFVSQHAIGGLGLLPKITENTTDEHK